MRALIFLLLLLLSPGSACAEGEPIVSVELQAGSTVVGQPLIVRIKVLVPTFSPTPPEFPSLEVPGLVVRLPERASSPISETVNGETWSGVQRAYRVYPLQPGEFEIPAQSIRVTYAEPGGIEPISVELQTQAIRFQATIPSDAEGLSPLIIAQGFALSQTLNIPDTLEIGGAVERSVEATINGTTAILIPPLLSAEASPDMRAYPKEPRVTESEERGVLSGQRVEAATYLAIAPGELVLPAIRFDWFNLETGRIETASVEDATATVTGTPAAEDRGGPNWTRVVIVLLITTAAFLLATRLGPPLRDTARRHRRRWENSEPFACRQVLRAIKRRDLSATFHTLGSWAKHFPDPPPHTLTAALADLGRERYGLRTVDESTLSWTALRKCFLRVRRDQLMNRRRTHRRGVLPAINPAN